MPFKIDLHCHSFFSSDAVSSPEALIAAARRKGLDGFALTDHNTSDGCRHLLDEGLMREDGEAVDGFLVIPGVEVSTNEGHLLCLGVIPPPLQGCAAAEVCHVVHELGGLVIPPHPYDLFRAGIRQAVLDTLRLDAVEAFNAATTLKRHNEKARAYAAARRLPMTAGSDAHHEAAIGTAYTVLPAAELSVGAILQQITLGGELKEEYLTVRHVVRKAWSNVMRLRPKRRHRPVERVEVLVRG